jgi:hypothetical protein
MQPAPTDHPESEVPAPAEIRVVLGPEHDERDEAAVDRARRALSDRFPTTYVVVEPVGGMTRIQAWADDGAGYPGKHHARLAMLIREIVRAACRQTKR